MDAVVDVCFRKNLSDVDVGAEGESVLFNCWFVPNWLSLWRADQFSRSLVLDGLGNALEGKRRDSRVGEIPSVVPANTSSEWGKSRL